MSNPQTHQCPPSNDEQRVRESLASLLANAGYDVCFHEIEKTSDESENRHPAHRIVLTMRPCASSPPSAVEERLPILRRSEKPPGHTISSRVTYQGIIYAICRSCYQLIGSGHVETIVSAAERFHHCPEMDANRGTSR
jgi:hypothetical protein